LPCAGAFLPGVSSDEGELQEGRESVKCSSGCRVRLGNLVACLLVLGVGAPGLLWSALLSLLALLSLRSLLSLEAKPAIEWQRAACTLASRWHTTREGSYSCVQRDLEPANQACSCASLDRGLHELAGMLALRSSVSSNLQFPASTSVPHSGPSTTFIPAHGWNIHGAPESRPWRIGVIARWYDPSSANCTAPAHRQSLSQRSHSYRREQPFVGNKPAREAPKGTSTVARMLLELADPMRRGPTLRVGRVLWIGHHT
jgi:hypothetical protein